MPPEATELNTAPSPSSGLLTSTSTSTPPSSTSSTSKGQWTPQTILSTIPSHSRPPTTPPSSPIAFFHILERLKTTKREGWRRFNITHGESISDHMYRMSIMTLLTPTSLQKSQKLDISRCMKMALVHDMAELLVGDITPVDGVLKPEKSRRETETMDYLCTHLLRGIDAGVQASEIRELWQEYEDSKTPESVYVHDIDKMELLVQMVDYEKAGNGQVDLGEFAHVADKIVNEEVKVWCHELIKERESFWKNVVGKAAGSGPPEKGTERREVLDRYYEDVDGGKKSNGA